MKAPKTGRKSKPSSSRPEPATTEERSSLASEADALAEILRRHDLTELEVENADVRIRVRRGGDVVAAIAHPPPHAAAPAHPPPAHAPPAPAAAPATATEEAGNLSYITSPFVGTFYRSPNPESAVFVEVGGRVHKGQVLCIVEAMKLMNEIECEVEGVIVQCLVENGQAVEYGEPLFKIKQG
jgi:acetyl-CoA carboxylase biotin carboxyl carrier protein